MSSKKFETSAKQLKHVKSAEFSFREPMTGTDWTEYWETYYATIGDYDTRRRSPGAQLEAKFEGFKALMESGSYVDSQSNVHDLKLEGMKAPLQVIQWVVDTADPYVASQVEIAPNS